MKSPCSFLLALGLFLLPLSASAQAGSSVEVTAVDAIFAAFDGTRTPGCAVGVSSDGFPVLLRAYGMADLEHDVANTAETVFEPGSVSKQFTAAATVLLALDGKIALDDDIRDYIPELADYGDVVTIRHLLNHTSGLRDWGAVAGIEGWPRTRRAHNHTHVLDIASRQESLNYPPGQYYSYTNTGYNLQAILVERVSGMPFAEFSRTRIFEPLGMDHTEWRDDFNRIVKNRAVAYRGMGGGEWSMLMPFEDVHGNGGLLTTVEDLLRFTAALESGELGGEAFLREMHTQGGLTSGQTIAYASGIQLRNYKGVPIVEHSGSTAGYRGHLARFPDQGLGFAVMCNTTTGNAGALLKQVADLYLGEAVSRYTSPDPGPSANVSQTILEGLAGNYRDMRRETLARITAVDGGLRMGGSFLRPVSETRFMADGIEVSFDSSPSSQGRPGATMNSDGADNVRLEPVDHFDPSETQLADYLGVYRSDEAEATYSVEIENGTFVLKNRWGQGRLLMPLYPDAFGSGGNTFIFRRDGSGKVVAVSLSQGRVWDLRFRKVG